MNPILTLHIACIGGEHLYRPYALVLDISLEATLRDLAQAILDVLDFDGAHLDEFYLARTAQGKQTALGTADDPAAADAEAKAMPLSAVFPLPKGKKLYYLYDFGACWMFEISRHETQSATSKDIELPRIVEESGSRPQEYGDEDE